MHGDPALSGIEDAEEAGHELARRLRGIPEVELVMLETRCKERLPAVVDLSEADDSSDVQVLQQRGGKLRGEVSLTVVLVGALSPDEVYRALDCDEPPWHDLM